MTLMRRTARLLRVWNIGPFKGVSVTAVSARVPAYGQTMIIPRKDVLSSPGRRPSALPDDVVAGNGET
ncbi:hypothetical protein GCM10009841_18330 [Microlunatus panaciterrae]